ncbi:MAG: 5'/3'-nucleotidase SurE [Anaerolineales bacterium]|nr:5'/3'-nucleotidase SurE [Anaerolineales bacterium]
MTHILVTNDDGVHAPGLPVLADALRAVGDVTVCVPEHNWSAGGHVKTLHKPLRAWAARLSDGSPAIVTSGAPSDCVALAMLGLVPIRVDIVVSGINTGPNLGYDLTYSGTVTAAMEAVINGAPGIAVSLCVQDTATEDAYLPAARFTARAVAAVLRNTLPEGILLNVNIPNLAEDAVRGVRITKLGLRVYRDELITRMDPRGKPYYWIGGGPPDGILEEDSDFWAVTKGYISITPVQLDLTAYDTLRSMQAWRWEEQTAGGGKDA